MPSEIWEIEEGGVRLGQSGAEGGADARGCVDGPHPRVPRPFKHNSDKTDNTTHSAHGHLLLVQAGKINLFIADNLIGTEIRARSACVLVWYMDQF